MSFPKITKDSDAVTKCKSFKHVYWLEVFDATFWALYDSTAFKTPWWNWVGLALTIFPILLMIILLFMDVISHLHL